MTNKDRINSVDKLVRTKLTKPIKENLYRERSSLRKKSKMRFGLLFEVPIYVQDPLVAAYNPATGIQEVEVSWEPGLGDGPTNARLAVVDFNSDTDILIPSSKWNQDKWMFETADGQPLDAADATSFQFHQVNAWATVQRVLDYYESPRALGRPIPWGFEGNRLIIVPHAGYGENAFYDRKSKSLQFFNFGTKKKPRYTCLSHDIVAHETGHAVLDGIRPYYLELSSLETAAFHEFVGDLTAILLALDNKDIREHMASIKRKEGDDNFAIALDFVARLAEEFGKHVENRPFLRTASKKVPMSKIKGSISPHKNSTVLTSAMFEVLIRIAQTYAVKDVSARQVLYWSYNTFRRIALQPLDLCPPADIRFVDYARAVLHNDQLTNPVDEKGYRKIIYDVFHEWEICQYSVEEHKAGKCDFNYENKLHSGDLITGDINSIGRSRTSAYHFLNDNRDKLFIPQGQDFFIADLYDTNKMDSSAIRQPREVVLQYLWREPVDLVGTDFGRFEGQTVQLLCGGTIVFDGRGNIISWFRKPGTDVPKDKKEGEKRRQELLEYVKNRVTSGHLTMAEEDDGLAALQSPAVARVVDGELRIEISPHLRKLDEDVEEETWTTSL